VPRSSKATGEGFWGDSMPAPAPAPAPAGDAAPAAAENDEITIDSKFKALLAELTAVRAADASAKTLIFSQFAHSLAWLGKSLAAHGYTCATITGSMSLSARAKALEAFQNAPPTTIFLLSLRSGAVGLNLTAASHIILLEPCMNPALEEQAFGRVYRLGQTRATQVKRLVAANTIEQRMRAVVESRVAGRPAEASVHSAMLAIKKPVLALEGTVPSVAGGMRSDRAVLRYDELNALFGH
jgi:SNF2 family DNA or RNA helicase